MLATEPNVVNAIAEEFYAGEPTDERFRTAVYKISKNFIIVKPTHKTKNFIQKYNESTEGEKIYNMGFKKTDPGLTIEELFLRAIAFQRDNPFKYMSERATFIPKIQDVMEFIESIEILDKITKNPNEKSEKYLGGEIPLFTHPTADRISNSFKKLVEKSSPLIEVGRVWHEPYKYKNGKRSILTNVTQAHLDVYRLQKEKDTDYVGEIILMLNSLFEFGNKCRATNDRCLEVYFDDKLAMEIYVDRYNRGRDTKRKIKNALGIKKQDESKYEDKIFKVSVNILIPSDQYYEMALKLEDENEDEDEDA